MKNVFRFILTSLYTGLLFAIPTSLLIMGIPKDFDIYGFLDLLWFGPALISGLFIVGLISKIADKNVVFKNNKFIKWNDFINNKSVIVTAIFCCILSLFSLEHSLLFMHYFNTEQYDKAITIAKISSKIYPYDCRIYSDLAHSYYQKQDYDKSIYYNNKRLQCEPDNYFPHINNARAIYLKNKDNLNSKYKNIVNELDKSLKINNDSFVALMGKQDIHFKINDCQNGIDDVEKILNIINKKGTEKYEYKLIGPNIIESLPNNWRSLVIANLSACPNSKEKEALLKKLQK